MEKEEWLWNSRDGVTPFVIPSADGSVRMKHVDFFRDVRAPFHVPPEGSRVFVGEGDEPRIATVDRSMRASFRARRPRRPGASDA